MHDGIMDDAMSTHTVQPFGHVRLLLRVHAHWGKKRLVKVVTGCTGGS